MKQFLNYIKEAVGVPENIVETAELVYNRTLAELTNLKRWFKSAKLDCGALNNHVMTFRDNFRISNVSFPEIELGFTVIFESEERRTDNITEWINEISDENNRVFILDLSNDVKEGRITEVDFKRKLKNISPDEIIANMRNLYEVSFETIGKRFRMKSLDTNKGTKIFIDFLVRKGTTVDEICDDFESRRSYYISGITHELKHYFDRITVGDVSPKKQMDYYAVNIQFDSKIFPIYDFIYKLYYFHDVENSVRPSELIALLKNEGITKSNFKEFFFKTSIWQQIEDAKKMNYDEIKFDLKGYYLEEIDDFFEKLSTKKKYFDDTVKEILKRDDIAAAIDEAIAGGLTTSKDDIIELKVEVILGAIENSIINNDIKDLKVETILELVYQTMIMSKTKELSDNLDLTSEDPLKMKGTAKEKFLNDYSSHIYKYKNYEDFFRQEIKIIKKEANKLFRKVAGVYSITADDTPTKKTKETIPFTIGESLLLDWEKWEKKNKKNKL
jgi:hypothetical protein